MVTVGRVEGVFGPNAPWRGVRVRENSPMLITGRI
jgi:hypothetical protein